MMPHPLDEALAYAARGWAVFPCNGKVPLTPHGCKDAALDDDLVARWWARWPAASVAIATGPASGLLVVDVDGPTGEETIVGLQLRHGRLPDAPWVRTGGGWHCYVAWPGGTDSLQSAGRLGPGVDTRGAGGYVIAPPSLHVSGRRYEWSSPGPVEAAPAWLLQCLRPPAAPGPRPWAAGASGRRGAAGAALAGACRVVAGAPAGCRNDRLNWASWRMRERVAAGELDPDDVTRALLSAAAACGLPPAEARRTIDSGLGHRGRRTA